MIFENSDNFAAQVEEFVRKNGGGYIEAVLGLCEEKNIEPQVAAKFLTKPIIEKLENEGQESNLLPRGARLPL